MFTLLKIISTISVLLILFAALPTSDGFTAEALNSFKFIFDSAYAWNFLVPVNTLWEATLFTIFGQFTIFTLYIVFLVLKIVRQ